MEEVIPMDDSDMNDMVKEMEAQANQIISQIFGGNVFLQQPQPKPKIIKTCQNGGCSDKAFMLCGFCALGYCEKHLVEHISPEFIKLWQNRD